MTDQKSRSRIFRYGAIYLALTILFLLLAEGLASFAYVASLLLFSPTGRFAEYLHTRYDSELGWENIPNTYIQNMYGPGIYLRINSQGFRNDEDITNRIPAGKFRIICSGDSFTLGYGVDNAHSWVQVLSQMDKRLQTVNMGQGGYGIDQAYLWFVRDGSKLDHDLQIFAFINDDFYRMAVDTFIGYGKPVLAMEGGKLVVRNVPVPKHSPLLARSLPALNELRTLRIMHYAVRRVSRSNGGLEFEPEKRFQRLPIALKVFETLREIEQQKDRVLIFVYLPLESDSNGSAESDGLRRSLSAESEKRGLRFWDLTDDFQKLPSKEMKKMFIGSGQMSFVGAAGHYTPEGNRYVAELLYQRIVATPAVTQRLDKLGPASH